MHAVEDVSFSLHAGETLALVGESGCGKSTTGRSILRLVEPKSGSILFEGNDVRALDREGLRAARRRMQMIFQDPFASLNPRKTVGGAIAEPMRVHGLLGRSDAHERVGELFRKVGLPPAMASRFPHEFSGGQRQRLCIARALALEPKLLVADEAVSALDVSIKAQVINLMMDLQSEMGLAYLFISHDIAVVERISHRIAVMYLGEIVEIGPRAAIMENPQHPYTKRLLAAVPVPEAGRRAPAARTVDDRSAEPRARSRITSRRRASIARSARVMSCRRSTPRFLVRARTMTASPPASASVARFIRELRFAAAPAEVQRQTRRCLLDTLGVAFAGTQLPIAGIVRRFVVRHLGVGEGCGARLILDGCRVSVPGAAMAGAAIIDGYDAHDGHALCKGHIGVTVVPAALAFADELALDDWDELLSLVLLGYEIGTRSGIALHASAPTMHSSGAWNALAAAAIGARALRLSDEQIAHALGIAEYYGPRSPLMRIIEHPTMLKDGSTMGAFAGVTAAYLAHDGFTGAPAETVDLDTARDTRALWADLGSRWCILEQYFKPMPVCRWTQPAAEAVLALRCKHPGLAHTDVRAVEVQSFHEAVSLGCRVPVETDAAQYSLPFVVAATLVHGRRLTPAEITGAGLHDADVLNLSRTMSLVETGEFNARFPGERWARVLLTLQDGTSLDSGPHTTRGDPDTPLSEDALSAKFQISAAAALGESAAREIEQWIMTRATGAKLSEFLHLILTQRRP